MSQYYTTKLEPALATLVGCWAHARRKFTDCIKGRKPNAKPGKPHWAVNHIKKLYAIEQQIKDLTVEQRHQVRQHKSKPLLDQYRQWLD